MKITISKLIVIIFIALISISYRTSQSSQKAKTNINKSQKQTHKQFQKQQQLQLKKIEHKCSVNEDCKELNFCLLSTCHHKSFFPPQSKELSGSILLFLFSAISNAGGTGGGGIIPPLMTFYFNFDSHEGVFISKMIIFSGSLTALVINRNNTSPLNKNKTAVDFNIVILVIPLILFGSTLGVILNLILPTIITYILFCLIIGINFWKTLKKALVLRDKENLILNFNGNDNGGTRDSNSKKSYFKRKNKNDSNNNTLNNNSSSSNSYEDEVSYLTANTSNNNYKNNNNNNNNNNTNTNDMSSEEDSIFNYKECSVVNKLLISYELEKDKRRFPFYKIIFCFISLVILLMTTLLKGSKTVHSIVAIENCSSLYWLIEFTFFPISLAITANVAKLIKEEYEYRKTIGYKYHKKEIVWNKKTLYQFSFIGIFTGLISGTLGIGSGLVLVPCLLIVGVNPIIATATSMFVVVFESFSVMFQFLLLGKFNFDYGIICSVISGLGSYFSTILLRNYLSKTRRLSVIVFCVAACLCTAFLIFFVNLIKLYGNIITGEIEVSFNSPC